MMFGLFGAGLPTSKGLGSYSGGALVPDRSLHAPVALVAGRIFD